MTLVTLILAATMSGPIDIHAETARIQASNNRISSLYDTWQQLHAPVSRGLPAPNAFLIIEPREGSLWIEKDGKVDPAHVRPLPGGLEWFAYYSTAQGVAEIKFPVRIRRPDTSNVRPHTQETVWVFGTSKLREMHMQVSVLSRGHSMTCGGSNGSITTWTVGLPTFKPDELPAHPLDSMFIQSTPHGPRFAEALRNNWFTVKVIRSPENP